MALKISGSCTDKPTCISTFVHYSLSDVFLQQSPVLNYFHYDSPRKHYDHSVLLSGSFVQCVEENTAKEGRRKWASPSRCYLSRSKIRRLSKDKLQKEKAEGEG